nr:hypothetical protein [Tanacetum cinerariifolium]
MVERNDEIKVLGEVNMELESGNKNLREKLNHEEYTKEEALEEFNSILDNVLEKLSHEKDSLDDFYGFMYEIDEDTSISGKSCEHFEVAEEVIEVANDQAEALSDQELTDECLDDEQVKERRPRKRIRVTQ